MESEPHAIPLKRLPRKTSPEFSNLIARSIFHPLYPLRYKGFFVGGVFGVSEKWG